MYLTLAVKDSLNSLEKSVVNPLQNCDYYWVTFYLCTSLFDSTKTLQERAQL